MSDDKKSEEPLTEEQRELVTKNHNLIYGYAYKRKISIDEYYGILAIALCKAAKGFDKSKAEFTTFAFNCMENELCSYWKETQKKSAIPSESIVPYDAQTFEEDSNNQNNFLENFPDYKSYNDMIYAIMSSEFAQKLTAREKTIVYLLITGLTHSEIAEKFGCNRQNITYFVGRIRKKLNDYLS